MNRKREAVRGAFLFIFWNGNEAFDFVCWGVFQVGSAEPGIAELM